MNRCLHCVHMDLKQHPQHARSGFCNCKKGAPGQFVSVHRETECENHAEAAAEVIRKRDEWLESRRKGEMR